MDWAGAEPSAQARLAEIPAVTPAATITLLRKNSRRLVPIPFVMIAFPNGGTRASQRVRFYLKIRLSI